MFFTSTKELAIANTSYLVSTPSGPPNVQTPQSRATIPPKQFLQPNQIPNGFIHRHFPHVPEQSYKYLYGIRQIPNALITVISQSPEIVNKWHLHRHHHLHAIISLLTQMYGFRGPDTMTRVTEWLDTTNARDPKAYYPHSYPICVPSSPKDLVHRPREVLNLVEFRTRRISSGDSIIYSMKMLNNNNQWNELNLSQLYRYVRRKADTCPLHKIYEVILYIMYQDQLLNMFPIVKNSCDRFTRIVTPSFDSGGQRTSEDIVHFHPYTAF